MPTSPIVLLQLALAVAGVAARSKGGADERLEACAVTAARAVRGAA